MLPPPQDLPFQTGNPMLRPAIHIPPQDLPFQTGNPVLRPAIIGHVHLLCTSASFEKACGYITFYRVSVGLTSQLGMRICFAQAQALRKHAGT